MDSLGVGIVIGVLSAFIGGLLLYAFLGFIQRRPRLEWFVLDDFEIPNNFGYFKKLEDLFEQSWEPDAPLSRDAATLLREGIREARQGFSLVADNSGRGPAKGIKILLDKEPSGFQVIPTVSVQKSKDASGNYAFEIDAIPPTSSVKVVFYGVWKYDLKAVYFDGHSLKEKYSRKIGPHDPDRRFTIYFVAFIFWIGLLVGDVIPDLLRESSTLEQDGQTGSAEVGVDPAQ